MEVVHHHVGSPRKITTAQNEKTTHVRRRALLASSGGGFVTAFNGGAWESSLDPAGKSVPTSAIGARVGGEGFGWLLSDDAVKSQISSLSQRPELFILQGRRAGGRPSELSHPDQPL